MQAWPDLHGCTSVAWDVTDIGARGILLDSWHGRNSLSLAHLGCQCCRSSGMLAACVVQVGMMQVCHWEVVSCWSLWCGSCATWGSVDCFDTPFTKVSPHAVICGTTAGVLDSCSVGETYHSSRNSNLFWGCCTLQLVDQHTVVQVFCCTCQPVIWQLQSMCQSTHGLVWLMGCCCISWLEWLFWVGIDTTALLEMEAWCQWV